MRHLLLILTFITSFNSFSQDKNENNDAEVTTYYFIRHAEKDQSNTSDKNPHLSKEGLERAVNWSTILGNVKFDAIYATNYHRTNETAAPALKKNKLYITSYEFPKIIQDMDAFLKETKAKNILIVGHSNTTPVFVNAIIGHKKYENMSEDNYGNLYIVTIVDGKVTDTVLNIN